MSESNRFDWKRFWYPFGTTVSFADDGFVADPEGEYGSYLNPELSGLTRYEEKQCLVLLGEPGLGKSDALDQYRVQLLETLAGSPDRVELINLKNFGSDFALVRNIFESNPIVSWVAGEGRLFLLFDSLDEGMLRVEALSGLLIQEFRKLPVERLWVCIVCRPAVWPSSFGDDLRLLWGDKRVSVLKLAPLRRRDVELAASEFDSANFVQEIIKRGLVPFAIKPFTLRALISAYRETNTLPADQLEIYRRLCRVAATEMNPSRLERGTTGLFTAEDRLQVSRRLGAFSVFSNKTLIRTDLPLDGAPAGEIDLDAVYGTDFLPSGQPVQIGTIGLRETLDTSLFNWQSAHQVSWDHRSYAEFLAAEYLHFRGVSRKNLKRLVLTEQEGHLRVPPQLYETVAWLCTFFPWLTKVLLKNDPVVLLLSDVLRTDEQVRWNLTARLLELFETEEILERPVRNALERLRHPKIAEQLRPFLSRRKKTNARLAAIDISELCKVTELERDLLSLALDSTDIYHLRSRAVFALAQFGSPNVRRELKHLLVADSKEDPRDELKGWALMAMWPEQISIAEVLEALAPRRDEHFMGGYAIFVTQLARTIGAQLTPTTLPSALDWVMKQPHLPRVLNRLHSVSDAILTYAWAHLHLPDVSSRFAEIAFHKAKQHERVIEADTLVNKGQPVLFKLIDADSGRRHLLFRALLHLLASQADLRTAVVRLIFSPDRPIRARDAHWLVDQMPRSTVEERRVITEILDLLPIDAALLDAIRRGVDEGLVPLQLRNRLVIDLDSDIARNLREHYEYEQECSKPPELLTPSPVERIAMLLDQIEVGNLDAWSSLTRTLTLQPTSQYYENEGSDLRKLPGWIDSDVAMRARIIGAGKAFLSSFEPDPAEYTKQTFDHWIIAAYLAFVLLYEEDAAYLFSQPPAFWHRWAGLLLSYKFDYQTSTAGTLLAHIAEHHPSALVQAVHETLPSDTGDCHQISALRNRLTPEIESILIDKLRTPDRGLSCFTSILEVLLQSGSEAGETVAREYVEHRSNFERSVSSAILLIRYATERSWKPVWRVIQVDNAFGRRVAEGLTDFASSTSFATELSDDALGDLFIWLAEQYPYSEDREPGGGAFAMGSEEMARDLRNALLNSLKGRGTKQALEKLGLAKQKLGLDWLRWVVVDARQVHLRNIWDPIEPNALTGLLPTPNDLRLTAKWQEYVLAGLVAFVVNLLTPISVGPATRFLFVLAVVLVGFVIVESMRKVSSWLLPLWIILLSTDLLLLCLSFFLPIFR